MFDWVKDFVERWAGQVAAPVRDLVHWAVHALAGVVYAVFGNVGSAWHDVFAAARWIESTATDLVHWIVTHLTWLIKHAIPALGQLILHYWRDALNFATSLYHDLQRGLQQLTGLARRWVDDALAWVHDHVWAPLVADAKQLRNDLLKWGFFAYDLLTHPARLAGILVLPLIAAAEAVFWQIAAPAGEFALRLVLANARRFAQLAETILTAVL